EMTEKLTKPFAKYPHYRRAGRIITIAGQGCRDPQTDQYAGITRDSVGKITGYDIVAQTKGVIRNIERALAAAGLNKTHLVDVTVYLKSMKDFAHMNTVWNDWVPDPSPTRTTVAVSGLPGDNYIEMKAL